MSNSQVQERTNRVRRPRVLMVNWVYYPEYGGGALQCRLLAMRLAQMGIHVEVLARTLRDDLLGSSIVEGFPVTRVNGVNGTIGRRLKTAAHLILELTHNCRRFDIVHTHGFMPEVTSAARLLGCKTVQKVTLIGLDDGHSVRNRRLGLIAHRAFSMPNALVGTSQAVAASVMESGVPVEKVWCIPNGVDLERFAPTSSQEKRRLRRKLRLSEEELLILFVGVVHRRKGLDLLIEAFEKVRSRLSMPIRLLLVGPNSGSTSASEFYKKIARQVRDNKLSRKVRFEGEKANVEEYYKSADIFVLPSRAEGQPNALLEAMACGLPVIANRLTGVTDSLITDRRNGRLIDCGNVDEFADSVVEMASQQSLRSSMGSRAREFVERHHDIRGVAEAYQTLYSNLLEG